MKKFFALLCIFLLLCGCSSHTGEISEISESSEASSAAGEPEPEAGSTAEEKPDVYLDPDGRLRFTGGFPDADSVLSWVLTFGDKAELMEPEELREQLRELTETLAHRY